MQRHEGAASARFALKPPGGEEVADGRGQRFALDLQVTGPTGNGTVRSGWIVRTGEGFQRLTSCYRF